MSTATTGTAVTARTRAAVSATASTSSTDGRQGSSTRSANPGGRLRRVVAAGPRWRVDDGKIGAGIGATL